MLELKKFKEGLYELSTIRDVYRYALTYANANKCFSGHGSQDLFNDLWFLISEILHIPHDSSNYFLDAKITNFEKDNLLSALEKRIYQYIPVPYIINKALQFGIEFYVDDRVLIPRSPIAELISNQFSPWINADEVSNILDLCTGSGCLAIAACYYFDQANVDAIDLSDDALAVATINQVKHNLQERLTLIKSDLWKNVPRKKYDVIISNPPYVSDENMQDLPAEYLHEPRPALFADNNGLHIINDILHHAKNYLNTNGILIIEAGCARDALIEKYPNVPFVWLEFEHGGEGVFLLKHQDIIDFFKDLQ